MTVDEFEDMLDRNGGTKREYIVDPMLEFSYKQQRYVNNYTFQEAYGEKSYDVYAGIREIA
ncbi:hypothetical protein SAMN02745248_01512 [Hathewaya proteolytica DSM 3090]|uniref:Uncharacterized protein n=2 Tax=Hathewaya proteolytica TaxID=29365 RepID=A0A1M6NVF1_9CLOT|nr:hypothetical protein SAMN02745248_01512 [Hathewaya proteolytica DSM 3090]